MTCFPGCIEVASVEQTLSCSLGCFHIGLSMIKVSLKKDGHYFCTHISQAVVEAVKPELPDTEAGGNQTDNIAVSMCSY